MDNDRKYAIAIVGAATAGAEAARVFSEAGFLSVVFDMHPLPYGKILDGLPRWHVGLRKKECNTIDRKLTLPGVHFVPKTRLGADIQIGDLTEEWGFHAVVLALGAWRDRPLPIEGAEPYVDKALIYQNPFVYWFNHHHEKDYKGPVYPIVDGTMVVGGGLASIDVAKIVQFELVLRALRERGIEQDVEAIEMQGIPATLESHGLTWEELGYEGCTLYYRRRIDDMPLATMPPGADDAKRAKVEATRRHILEKAAAKYHFKVVPLHSPAGLIVKDGHLIGLEFARTRIEDGKLTVTDEMVSVLAPLIISSIGSIPEILPGIAMRGEVFDFSDDELGTFDDRPGVFSAGNVVTGKGNLVTSRKHATKVATHLVDDYNKRVADSVAKMPALSDTQAEELEKRIQTAQKRVGYDGDYQSWIRKVSPRE